MKILVITLFLLPFLIQKSPVNLENTPLPVLECLKPRASKLEISRRINPFYLQADFDGDGVRDYVVLVQELKSEKQGFVFCFQGAKKNMQIVGAGVTASMEKGTLVDDMTGIDVWGVIQSRPAPQKNDFLYLEKAESGNGIFKWNGSKMIWQQGGI